MKKILLIIALFGGFVANSQQLPGYTDINSRYRWLAGIFRALNLPAGSGPAALTTGQSTFNVPVYVDTLGADAGVYLYINGEWVLQGTGAAAFLPDALLAGGSVTPQGTGFNMSVEAAVYRINSVVYGSDSGTVTLSGSDPSLNRIDYIYLGTDGDFHVKEGVPGFPAAEPRLEPDQLGIAFVSIPAGSTTPGISTVVVYNENTESTVSNVGTTTDADNTVAGTVFTGAKSVNNSNIASNDRIIFTALTTFNAAGFDALAIHMKPKAVLASGNRLFIQLFVGSTAVSNSVELIWNRSNITTFQALSISAAALGTLQNYNVTSVRITYVGSSTNFAGFYFDYIFFQTGTSQPNPGGGGFPDITPPATWGVAGNGTENIIITPPGLRAQLMRGDATSETDSTVKYIGTINSQTKSANGAVINTATNQIVLQESDAANNGLTTALRHRQIDTLLAQTIENASLGDTLVYPIDEFRTGVKGLIAGTGITFVKTDTTITINSPGGGGAAPSFGIAGIDDVAAETRVFDLNNNAFQIGNSFGGTFNFIDFIDDQNFNVGSQGVTGDGYFTFSSGWVFLHDLDEVPSGANKMVVWDSATHRLSATQIPTGGGSDGNGIYDGSGSLTGNTAVALAGNTFSINQGANSFLSIDPTADAEEIRLQAVNTTGGGNSSFFESATSDVSAEFSFGASFNAGASQVSIGGVSASGVSALVLTADDITLTGAVKIVDGTESNGYVFTSDASGNGSWQPAPGGTPALTQYRLAIGDASSLLSTGAAITGNRALISDANGVPTHSITTATELTYVNGVTSAIQTQIDSKLGHTTANPAHTGTTPSGAGVIGAEMIARISNGNEFTLANSTSDQTLFPSAFNAWTLQGSTLYKVKFRLRFTTGSTSHTYAFGFTLGGGASITSMGIKTLSHVTAVNATSTASTHTYLDGVASTIVTAASTTSAFIEGEGFIVVNAGGTFEPIIKFSADPTGTCLLKENSYISFTPVGASTLQSIGNVN